MEKKTRSIQRMITILLVLAVLIMALPMTVMAKGKGKALGHNKQTLRIGQSDDDESEPAEEEEEEEEDSERSMLVAKRNEWARAHGVPPGHANLLYKYISTIPDAPELTSENLSDNLTLFSQEFFATYVAPDEPTVKAFRDWIKGLIITESGTDDTVMTV